MSRWGEVYFRYYRTEAAHGLVWARSLDTGEWHLLGWESQGIYRPDEWMRAP